MNDLSRDIGILEARMDDHDRRFDKLEEIIDTGFAKVNGQLDALSAERYQRKGAMGLVNLILGASGIAGIIELVKELFHK